MLSVGADQQRRKYKADGIGNIPNFPALELLHDPQTFGERLYDKIHRYGKLTLQQQS
jgi:protein SDA1